MSVVRRGVRGMDQVLDALGVIVVEVPGLRAEVAYVRDQGVGLIRAGLDDERHAGALDWLVTACCRESPTPR